MLLVREESHSNGISIDNEVSLNRKRDKSEVSCDSSKQRSWRLLEAKGLDGGRN